MKCISRHYARILFVIACTASSFSNCFGSAKPEPAQFAASPISPDADLIRCQYTLTKAIRLDLPTDSSNQKYKIETSLDSECDPAKHSDCFIEFRHLKTEPKVCQATDSVPETEYALETLTKDGLQAVFTEREPNTFIVHRIDFKYGTLLTTRSVDGLDLLYGDSGYVNFGKCFDSKQP